MRPINQRRAASRAESTQSDVSTCCGIKKLTTRPRSAPAGRSPSLARAVFVVRLLDSFGIRHAAMNPHAVAACDLLIGGQRFRIYTGPTDRKQPVLARHPFGREIGMAGVNEH